MGKQDSCSWMYKNNDYVMKTQCCWYVMKTYCCGKIPAYALTGLVRFPPQMWVEANQNRALIIHQNEKSSMSVSICKTF